MKIAVITTYFPSSGEPSQGRSLYQTLRVIARQAEVRVFFPNASYPTFLTPRTRSYSGLDRSYSPPGVRTSYHDYPALPLVSRPLNGWNATRALLPAVRAFAPDLIFSCFLYPEGRAAIRIGRALGVPAGAMSIGSDINRIGDPISALQTRSVLREADSVITVSADLRLKAISMGARPERSRAIVNGCDLAVFHPADRAEARRKLGIDAEAEAVIYIGRMDVRKGLRELIAAAAALHSQRPRMRVYLVGNGPDRPLLVSAIEAAQAGSYINALPGCAFDEVAVWMAAADLVTLPSYMEGCPNVVLEALASGRPVVATNVGGIPEILSEESGRLVPPRDSAALAEALASVLNQTWDAAAISARGSRSWEAVAAELFEVFVSLLSNRQAVTDAR